MQHMHLKSDEITALLRQQQGALVEADGACTAPSNCDVVYALFLEPHSSESAPTSRMELAIERLIESFTAAPSLVHVELLVPPIPNSGGGKVNFATYLSPPYKAEWQGADVDESVNYYLVTNGARWRALPVFLPHAVEAVRSAADANVDAPYSVPRYATSAKPFRRLAWLLPDADKAPGHCATLTARVLRRSGATDAVPRSSAWYSPSSLYTTLVAHASTRLTGADRAQMGSVAPAECTRDAEHAAQRPALVPDGARRRRRARHRRGARAHAARLQRGGGGGRRRLAHCAAGPGAGAAAVDAAARRRGRPRCAGCGGGARLTARRRVFGAE